MIGWAIFTPKGEMLGFTVNAEREGEIDWAALMSPAVPWPPEAKPIVYPTRTAADFSKIRAWNEFKARFNMESWVAESHGYTCRNVTIAECAPELPAQA